MCYECRPAAAAHAAVRRRDPRRVGAGRWRRGVHHVRRPAGRCGEGRRAARRQPWYVGRLPSIVAESNAVTAAVAMPAAGAGGRFGAMLWVFDINETMLDLAPLDAVFVESGLPGRRTDWFDLLIHAALVTTATGQYRD